MEKRKPILLSSLGLMREIIPIIEKDFSRMIVLLNTYAIYLTRDLDHRGTRSLEFKTKDEKDRDQEAN